MSLPKGIQFKTVKPQGFYQEWRDYFVTPVQTYTNQFSVYDIVRIQFNLQDWYIDPYESYIEAEVRLANETPLNPTLQIDPTSATDPVQFLMMDGPSTSLINDFRFEVNSKEIERIREYDQVGNLLTDLCMYPEAVDQKDYEGYYSIKGERTLPQANYAYNPVTYNTQQPTSNTQLSFMQRYSNTNIISPMSVSAGYTQTLEPIYNPSAPVVVNAVDSTVPILVAQTIPLSGQSSLSPNANYTGVKSGLTSDPIKILSGVTDTNFTTNNATCVSSLYDYYQYLGQLTAGNTNFGIQSSNYSELVSMNGGTANYPSAHIPCQVSPKLSQVDGHNIFLTNLPTSKIVNGQFVDQVYANYQTTMASRQYMQIPLLSGVMGVLIPQERWQLIPSSSLGNVNMEFRFNPNAFFSHDGSKPNWMVTKFQLRLRMYRFDAAVMSQLKSQVSGGIQMHSNVFSMGPIYNIQPNVSVTNNWQLNNGIPSIKQLFFWFLPNDYESYWHCRKNYKISQNITSMQLKVGSNYLPQNPILGYAGNIVMNQQTQQDNSVYLSELHQALNLLFDCKKHININKLNFAINDRPYDVTLTNMYNMLNPSTPSLQPGITPKKRQFLQNMGYTMWNEMRCRGKAVYAFNLEMDKKNDDTMSGLDTTKTRPIELILKNDSNIYFNRLSTMYVMFMSDFIVTFRDGDTDTEGYG